jgi:hypothetical protein
LSSDQFVPITTRLELRGLRLKGSYQFDEPAGREYGTLRDCGLASEWVVFCTWYDRYGKGGVELHFDREASSFDGSWWPAEDSEARAPWTGERNPSEEEASTGEDWD